MTKRVDRSAGAEAGSAAPAAPGAGSGEGGVAHAAADADAARRSRVPFRARTRDWLSGRSLSVAALFALNLFFVISAVLLVVTAVGFATVERGVLSEDFWGNPVLLTVLVLLLAALIAFAVLAMSESIILRPLRNMVAALQELAEGRFDVRVDRKRGVSIEELDDFVDAFNVTAEELGRVEVLRRDFVSDFSHEFKTPITSIAGFAELLLEDDLAEEERRSYTEVIARESRRLATMAEDVLALRQADALECVDDCEPVDVAEQVRRAVVLVGEKWGAKNLDIECDLAEARCLGSPALLDRAWVNLLDNACKFSPEGGRVCVSLRAGAGRGSAGGALSLRVENDGPAISPEARSRVFDRFYQDDPSHATQGCGLGLPLVKRAVELHGGSVSVESTPEGHTTFTVLLPLT